MRGINTLGFFLLDQGVVVISAKLDPWISTWWEESSISLSTKYWFEHKGYNLLWGPPLATAETAW